MRKLIAAIFPQAVLISCLIISFVFVVDIQKIKGAEPLTVEGVWVITSCKGVCDNDGYTIVRQGNHYKVTANGGNSDGIFDIYVGSSSEIVFKYAPNYNNWVSINKGHNVSDSILRELAGKVTLRHRFKLSADGNSMEKTWDAPEISYAKDTDRLVRVQVLSEYNRATLVRVTPAPGKLKTDGDRAYQANCGVIDPNRTTPFPPDHEFCPGNLVSMTNFCGGGMGCPYVCCPKGLPYLNHCDCKCYANSDFDCHSYSYGREKLIR